MDGFGFIVVLLALGFGFYGALNCKTSNYLFMIFGHMLSENIFSLYSICLTRVAIVISSIRVAAQQMGIGGKTTAIRKKRFPAFLGFRCE